MTLSLSQAATILVIEDNLIDRALLRQQIQYATRALPAQLLEAGSCGEAVTILDKQAVDLIFADLGLPDSDDLDTITSLRRTDTNAAIIVITSLDSDTYIGRAIEMGAQDYLVKGQISEGDIGRALRLAMARKDMEMRLFQESTRARTTLQAIADAVISTDAQGRIDYMNPQAERLTGWREPEARGQDIDTVFRVSASQADAAPISVVHRALSTGLACESSDAVLLGRDRQKRRIDDTAAPILDRQGKIAGAVLVFRDVTEQMKALDRIQYQARHDSLTGLANRFEFERELQILCSDKRDPDGWLACLFIDLDRFKRVNDVSGHLAGDELLRQLASLLRAQVRQGDLVARIGGDEFGILLDRCGAERAVQVAELLVQGVNAFALEWDGQSHSVGASVGIVVARKGHSVPRVVLDTADKACLTIKERGGSATLCIDAEAADAIPSEFKGPAAVSVIEQGNMRLFVQKCFPARADYESVSAAPNYIEILVRGVLPDGTVMDSSEFFGDADRYRMMTQVDRWVIAKTLACIASRPGVFGAQRPIWGINLSVASLADAGIAAFIQKTLTASGVDPSIICFEISEMVASAHLFRVGGLVRELKRLGCNIALDDFGGGVVTFEHFRSLPVDWLKIDGSIISRVPEHAFDTAVVEAIARVCRALDVRIIAEGVETRQTYEVLQYVGVDAMQGFLLHRPEPIENL